MSKFKIAAAVLVLATVSGVNASASEQTYKKSESVFSGMPVLTASQIKEFDSRFKTDEKLLKSLGVLSYTNFNDIFSQEDRKAIFQVRNFWNDNKPSDSQLWKVEERARTETILGLGIFNTKETLQNKLKDRYWNKLYNDSLSYVRSYQAYAVYKIHGPKATNDADLKQEASDNYYCAGVMTNVSQNLNDRAFNISEKYVEKIVDSLFDKGPQYKTLGAINNDQAAEQIRRGIDASINPATKSRSFNSCFRTAADKFEIR
jgi:hypothetical protein